MIPRILLAVLFMIAGALHFIHAPMYMRIMPPYLPAHRALVLISGACEILGGLGLLLPATRTIAAWGLIALLIAVLPANIQMIVDPSQWPAIPLWALWLRIPLQGVLIWWAWLYTRRP